MPLPGAQRYPIDSEPEITEASGQNTPAWRSEVASRVSNYRARHRNQAEMPALDFGPDLEDPVPTAPEIAPQQLEPLDDAFWHPLDPLPGQRSHPAAATEHEEPRPASPSIRAAHTPFDLDYYRRRNAESFRQPVAQGSLAPSLSLASMEASLPQPPVEEVAPAANDLLDLDLRKAPGEEAALDRYVIAPQSAEAAVQEPAQAPEPEIPLAVPAAAPDNLIVFRRPIIEPPLAPEPVRDELAEPMFSRPRILEVPEEIMPPVQGSLFPEIQLDGELDPPVQREAEVALPKAVAPVLDRLLAGLIDAGIVAASGLLFAGIAYFALPDVPHAKPFFLALTGAAVLFWAVYQHLFLLYAGKTPGMFLRQIHLSSFEGGMPEWSARSARARFACLSLASVLLGFIWALVDEKSLCWHDRGSRTFTVVD